MYLYAFLKLIPATLMIRESASFDTGSYKYNGKENEWDRDTLCLSSASYFSGIHLHRCSFYLVLFIHLFLIRAGRNMHQTVDLKEQPFFVLFVLGIVQRVFIPPEGHG